MSEADDIEYDLSRLRNRIDALTAELAALRTENEKLRASLVFIRDVPSTDYRYLKQLAREKLDEVKGGAS